MTEPKKCAKCGTALPPDAPGGHCPQCLLQLGLKIGQTHEIPVLEKSGDWIGRYKLLQQIGEGGCGVVHMAEQEEPVRRRVALKIIKLGMDTKSVIARFEAERQALAMMDHLVRRGHRTIGFIGAAVAGNPQAADRRRAYDEMVDAHALARAPTLAVECPSDLGAGAEALVRIVERHPNATAVFAASEVRAIGALLECQRRGWKVPDRLAIAGFNDAGMGAWLVPALTTVRIAREEIGRRSAQMILDRVEGRAIAETVVDVGFDLAIRASA